MYLPQPILRGNIQLRGRAEAIEGRWDGCRSMVNRRGGARRVGARTWVEKSDLDLGDFWSTKMGEG